jgi:hypothetical protein
MTGLSPASVDDERQDSDRGTFVGDSSFKVTAVSTYMCR